MNAGRADAGRLSWKAARPWLLVGLVAVLPFLNALPCGFAYDDGAIILGNPAVDAAAPWWRSLASPYWPAEQRAGLYRPLTLLTYRLQRGMTGDAPLPFHLANVLFHAGAALLSLALLRALWPRRGGLACAGALLFAVHPLHTEAVTGVVGRAEILAALGGLGGYLVWLRADARPRRALGCALLFALAAAAKESAAAWLLVLAAHRAGFFGDGRDYRSLAAARGGSRAALRAAWMVDGGVLAGFALYAAARLAVLGTLFPPLAVGMADNPLFHADLPTRLFTAAKVLVLGAALVVAPVRLSADYSFDAIALVRGPWPGLLWVAALLAPFALAWIWRAGRGAVMPPLLLYALLVLPVSNLVAPIGTIFGERLLYLPSLGLIAAAAAATATGLEQLRRPRLGILLLAAALLLLAVRTWDRNAVWRDDAALFAATVRAQPRSVKAQTNLGALLARREDWEAAEARYREALRILPGYPAAQNGLGHVLLMQGRLDEAEAAFEEALALHPRSVETLVRFGNLLLERRRPDEALARFDAALAAAPFAGAAWTGRASALFLLERHGESADAWERALAHSPPRPDLRPHLAAAYRAAGRSSDAERLLRELLRDAPDPARVEDLVRLLLARGDCDGAAAVLSSPPAASLDEPVRAELRRAVEECS